MSSALAPVMCALALVGCGGDGAGDGGNLRGTSASPPSPPTISASGGTVSESSGASIVVPAGALKFPMTLRVAKDATGAPIHVDGIDTELAPPVSNTYVLTPHGVSFPKPVTVSLPFDASKVGANDQLVIVKAQPGGDWEIYLDVRRNGDRVEGEFSSFSYFYVAKLQLTAPTSTTRGVPFSFRLVGLPAGGDDPYRSVRYEVSGSSPTCAGSSGYTTTLAYMTDYSNTTDPLITGVYILGPYAGQPTGFGASPYYPYGTRKVEHFDVAPARVAASPNVFSGEFLQGVSQPDSLSYSTGTTYQYQIESHDFVVIRGTYKCLLSTGKEITINGNNSSNWFAANGGLNPNRQGYWAWPELTYAPYVPTQPVVVLADSLSEFVTTGHGPLAAVTVRTGYTERRSEAGVYWDKSTDQGATWEQIGFVPASSAVVDTSLPSGGTPPPLKYELRLPSVTQRDNGAWVRMRYCTSPSTLTCAPETAGLTRGTAHTLAVGVQAAAPSFSQTPRSVLVRTGETASFSVVAAGLPIPTLQWQRLVPAVPPATSTWADIPGATSANYTTGALALANTGTQYRVRATNSAGEEMSLPATVSVSDTVLAPSIVSQPLSLSVVAGSEAVFAVHAIGTEALSYQWSLNGTPIQGANGSMLKLSAVTALDAGTYTVVVTNLVGTATSTSAMLTVTSGGTPTAVAPGIATQPASVTVNAGNTATFAVGVGGTSPFTFQWRKDGVDIPGATAATHTFAAAANDNGSQYSVRVTNSAGSVTSNAASLTVVAAPAPQAPIITTQPATVVVMPGASATLAVAASGSAPLSYQWSLNGVPIAGANGAVLQLSNVTSMDAGTYAVAISNSAGSANSNAAQLVLVGAPAITAGPVATSVTENSPATFSVTATGDALRYLWLRNGVAISSATGASYTIAATSLIDNGASYSVVVYNAAGILFSDSAVLTVLPVTAPAVLQQPAGATIDAGQSASLCASFGGTPPLTVRLQRWANNEWNNVPPTLAVNDNALTCAATGILQAADNGAQFRFSASNAAGQATTNAAMITVTAPPILTATTLVSVGFDGLPGDSMSDLPSISADGRLVAFRSSATNLVAGATPPGIYVRNLATGVTTLVTQTVGTPSINDRRMEAVKLAAGGRYVAFSSLAGDLVEGDTNGSQDVFLRDLQTNTTKRLNVLPNGSQLTNAGAGGISPSRVDVSADGRWVIFRSFYDLTGDGHELPTYALFARDTVLDRTRLVATGNPRFYISHNTISGSGEFIFYILPSDTNYEIHEYDIETGGDRVIFTLLNVATSTEYIESGLSTTYDGRYIAFSMRSTPLFGGSNLAQAVVIDRTLANNSFTIVSTGASGVGNNHSGSPVLSADGRYVLFPSLALNLTSGTQPLYPYLVMRDTVANTTAVASRAPDGTLLPTSSYLNGWHALSADGSVIAFSAAVSSGDQIFAAPRP